MSINKTYLNPDAIINDSIGIDKLSHKGGYIEIPYDELKQLISENKLISGKEYRITDYDYVPNPTEQLLTMGSAHNLFDVIVKASSPNTIFEDAKACLHEYSESLLGDSNDNGDDDEENSNDGNDDGGETSTKKGGSKSNDPFINSNLETWKLKFSLKEYSPTIDILTVFDGYNEYNEGRYYLDKEETITILDSSEKEVHITFLVWNQYFLETESEILPKQLVTDSENYNLYYIDVLNSKTEKDIKQEIIPDDGGFKREVRTVEVKPNKGIITEMIDQNGIKQNFDFKNRLYINKYYHCDIGNFDLTTGLSDFKNIKISNCDYIPRLILDAENYGKVDNIFEISNLKCDVPNCYKIILITSTPNLIRLKNIEIINSSNIIFTGENINIEDVIIKNSDSVTLSDIKNDIEIKNVKKSTIDWTLLESNVTVAPRKCDGVVVQYNVADLIADTGIIESLEQVEYIDFEIPDYNLLWAKYNLGASESEPYGDYFAWGEVNGYKFDENKKEFVVDLIGNSNDSTTKPKFDSEHYKYFSTSGNITRYNDSDKLTTLKQEDDAANVILGNGWRIPTSLDFSNLLRLMNESILQNKFDEDNNLLIWPKTMIVKEATDANKLLVFPAAGIAADESIQGFGTSENYCSSSIYEDGNYSDNHIMIFSNSDSDPNIAANIRRWFGIPIRPVKEKSK